MATNLFTYNQSTAETNTTGFTAVATTLSQDTTQAWQGTHAIKVVSSGVGSYQGVQVFIPASQFAPSTTYSFSCYLYVSSGTPSLRFYIQTDTGSFGGVGTISPTSGSWQRFTSTITTGATITSTEFGLRWDTGSTAQAVTIWMDGLQCEIGSAATTFTVGGFSFPTITFAAAGALSTTLAVTGSGSAYDAAVKADTPVLFWTLNDAASPTTIVDSSTGGHPGTPLGTLTFQQSGPASDSEKAVLGSSNGYITSGLSTSGYTAFTVEAMVKQTSNAGGQYIIGTGTDSNDGWTLGLNASLGSMYFALAQNSTTTNYFGPSDTFTSGLWYHLVVTYDGTNVNTYINGVLKTTTAQTGAVYGTNTVTALAVQNASYSFASTSTLSKLAVYNTALTGTRVTAHYNALSTGVNNLTATFVGSGMLQAKLGGKSYFRGMNVFGAWQGGYGGSDVFPTDSQMAYYHSKGFDWFRVPLRWEALQPTLSAALDPTYLAAMDAFVAIAASRGQHISFTVINQGQYPIGSDQLGSSTLPYAAFYDFWTRMATHYVGNQTIYAYDLMNEPWHTLNWPTASQGAINAIRAIDTVTPIITTPGPDEQPFRYTGFSSLYTGGNIWYEAHVYGDVPGDNSGYGNYSPNNYDTNGVGATGIVTRLGAFVNWVIANNVVGIVGEVGIPGVWTGGTSSGITGGGTYDSRWGTMLDNALTYLDQNGISSLYWSVGNYGDINSVEPVSGVDSPIMSTLTAHPSVLIQPYVTFTSIGTLFPNLQPSNTVIGLTIRAVGTLAVTLIAPTSYQLTTTFAGTSGMALVGPLATTVILSSTFQGKSVYSGSLTAYIPVSRGMKVMLQGQDISQYVDEMSIDIQCVLGQGSGTSKVGAGTSSTVTFDVALGPASSAIGSGQAIPVGVPTLVRQGEIIINDRYGNQIFGGYATKMDDITPKLAKRTSISGVDYWQDLDRVIINTVYLSMSDTAMITQALHTYAPWIDTSLIGTNQNYFFAKRKFTAKTLRALLTNICDVTGFLAWVSPDKKFHYVNPAALNTAPFSVSDTPNNVNSFAHQVTKLEQDDNAIINRVMFYGGKKTTSDFTQDISTQANGSNTTFILAYEPRESSDGKYHVHVGGVDLAVGRASGDTTQPANILKSQGGLADVLVDSTNYTLTFNVAPSNTGANSVTATYRYTTSLVVLITATDSYAFFGRYFDGTISDTSVYDQQTAIQRCRVLLAEQKYGLFSMEIITRQPGLMPGQMLRVVNTVKGINASFQIQKISIKSYGAGIFNYTVELGAWNWNMVDVIMQAALAGVFDDTTQDDTTDPVQVYQYQQNVGLHLVASYKATNSGHYYAHSSATGNGDAYSGMFTITS